MLHATSEVYFCTHITYLSSKHSALHSFSFLTNLSFLFWNCYETALSFCPTDMMTGVMLSNETDTHPCGYVGLLFQTVTPQMNMFNNYIICTWAWSSWVGNQYNIWIRKQSNIPPYVSDEVMVLQGFLSCFIFSSSLSILCLCRIFSLSNDFKWNRTTEWMVLSNVCFYLCTSIHPSIHIRKHT